MSEPVVIPSDAFQQIKALLETSIAESRADRQRIRRLERHVLLLWCCVVLSGAVGWLAGAWIAVRF